MEPAPWDDGNVSGVRRRAEDEPLACEGDHEQEEGSGDDKRVEKATEGEGSLFGTNRKVDREVVGSTTKLGANRRVWS